MKEYPKDGRGEPYTPERVKHHARDHVAYGWTKRPGGWSGEPWTAELLALYDAEYELAKREQKEGGKMQTYYNVFVRDWYKPNPGWPNGREPHAGDREYIAEHVTYADARALCKEYNDNNDPGPMSRKAEFEEA